MADLNQQFLYSILIITLGYILKRTNILKEHDGEGLARIIFNITLPALIITAFHDIEIDISLFLLVIIGIFYGIFAAFLSLYFFRKENRTTKGMLSMMLPGFNIGLFAYPLVEGIWGDEGIKYFGMLDVGNAFIVFGLIYIIGGFYSADNVKMNVKYVVGTMAKSIPLMTYMVVFLLNIFGFSLPKLVLQTSSIISNANMPMSLLLLGIYLNFTFDETYARLIRKFLTIRYVVGLSVGLIFYVFLPVEDMIKNTLLIGLILPVATSVLPYSIEFGYNPKFAGMVSNITLVISFLFIWAMANILI
ncbi:AEC family transporter [Aquibacillus sp. 3ASR75-11]|uniref:AEC family transporter n=1 Tax=Terrihalobacillus insolitus TaxID=2950438 RepID=A0A9X3WVL7_9BACI|nr:AEC family transporter [Terrihalobacillus insolitus]MDC3414054.1 AEC family transporter [Terrihalobacillus insolitus]MDC3424144.1 AEC family transporter [Terrihalobacillus insolitus]